MQKAAGACPPVAGGDPGQPLLLPLHPAHGQTEGLDPGPWRKKGWGLRETAPLNTELHSG